MAEWRPDGWKNDYRREADVCGRQGHYRQGVRANSEAMAYEAGADAMLAALKTDGNADYCEAGDWIETVADNDDGAHISGTWVFIPDEKE